MKVLIGILTLLVVGLSSIIIIHTVTPDDKYQFPVGTMSPREGIGYYYDNSHSVGIWVSQYGMTALPAGQIINPSGPANIWGVK